MQAFGSITEFVLLLAFSLISSTPLGRRGNADSPAKVTDCQLASSISLDALGHCRGTGWSEVGACRPGRGMIAHNFVGELCGYDRWLVVEVQPGTATAGLGLVQYLDLL